MFGSTYVTSSNQQAKNAAAAVTLLFLFLIVTVFLVVTIVALWKVFSKAGRPGWAAIIPIYSGWVLAEIAGKPGWWVFLEMIPIVNIVLSIIIAVNVARNFGKSDLFGFFGLWLFSFIGYLMIGFGSAKYRGANGSYGAPDGPQPPVAPTPNTTPITPQQPK
jgi:hypothetical protein